jgi:hypothetical protein
LLLHHVLAVLPLALTPVSLSLMYCSYPLHKGMLLSHVYLQAPGDGGGG